MNIMSEPTIKELWLECEWLALLAVAARRRVKRSKSLRLVWEKLEDAIGGLEPGQSPERSKLLAARDAFYALPEKRLTSVLNGWSPAPGRPTLQELFGAMEEQHVARVLSLVAPPAAWSAAGIVFTHNFRPAGGHSAVRVEITEGATRAEVLAGLQTIAELLIDHWADLIDGGKTKGIGRTVDEARSVDNHLASEGWGSRQQ